MSMGQTNSSFHQDDTNASPVHPFEVRLQKLKQLFVIGDQPRVQRVLKTDPSLLPVLLDAHEYIQKYFPDSQVKLDAAADPYGITGDNEELVASICTSLEGKEALEKLGQFYDDWYPHHASEATDKIAIGLELE